MYTMQSILYLAAVCWLCTLVSTERVLRGDGTRRSNLRDRTRARQYPGANFGQRVSKDEEERKERSLLNTFPFRRPEAYEEDYANTAYNDVHDLQGVHDNHNANGLQAHGVHNELYSQEPNHAEHNLPLSEDLSGFRPSPVFPSVQLPARESRQRANTTPNPKSVSFQQVAGSSPGSDGRRCIDKVEMIEETEYDEVVQCDHSYDRRCHTTYITTYLSQQEEECNENFRKSCYIEYETIAFNQTVQVCRTPLEKDCNVQGPELCSTQYESECWTKNEEHDVEDDVVECQTIKEENCEDLVSGYTSEQQCSVWPKEVCSVSKKEVKKFTPITACHKEPKEICAPAGCGFREGSEQCFDKTQTVVQDAPKEECTLEPQRTCEHVTKLVPKLEPSEECVDVPKEVCTRSKKNPRKVKKPVVKKWCYNPTAESGLA